MKLLLKLTAGLFAIALIGLGIFYVPPHVQTLSTSPDLPSEEALRELMNVENGPISVKYILNASQEFPPAGLAHTAFVVEWANGDLFLIDFGMDKPTADDFAIYFQNLTGAGDAEFHGTVTDLLGDRVDDVKGVALTHLHWDHIQGVEQLCDAVSEAPMVLQTEDQRTKPIWRTSPELIKDSCLTPAPLEGDLVLTNDTFPGLALIQIGGHTPGSTLIAVSVKDRLWLFSGDTFNNRQHLSSGEGRPYVYTTFIVPENRFQNERLYEWFLDLDKKEDMEVVVSHDLNRLSEWDMPAFNE